ncbi:hypothetical protein [Georgenia sunbinii]|uniref:hypothetical protein n=1 Tax=Georgenia sunbinii TaxID=3117728 RepID=UPI002F25FAAF
MENAAPIPDDVRLARAVRALRDTLVGCGVACLGLGVIAMAIVALASPASAVSWPTVTLLGGGQLLALVGAGLSAVALRGSLVGQPTDVLLRTTRRRLGLLARVVVGWCVAAAAAWVIAYPSTAVLSLALAAVTAQLAVALRVLGGRLSS